MGRHDTSLLLRNELLLLGKLLFEASKFELLTLSLCSELHADAELAFGLAMHDR